MKNLNGKYSLFKKKAIYLFGSMACVIVALVITYSCKEDILSTTNEPLPVPEVKAFEKQLIVYDESGNNSVTVKISSNDESLLADYSVFRYELLINSVISEETTNEELQNDFEEPEAFGLQESMELTGPTVQIDIIDVNFKDKVNNYSLVSHGSFNFEEEANMKSANAEQGIFCWWHPRPKEGFQYYEINNSLAKKITTKLTSSKVCNNMEWFICPYNSNEPFKNYKLKKKGDSVTTNASGTGITALYRTYKNATYELTWGF